MGNKDDFNCFDYVSNQIKAYVVNRLANAPCTTAQLVGTFSLIVDQLSIAEKSLIYVLDALYKEKVIDFTLVNNNTRLYSLVNFDKDYIFELNIEKVEELIAEYKLPYFADHRKDVEDALYFEARKNRTCIYINSPIPVVEKNVVEVIPDVQTVVAGNVTQENDDNTNSNENSPETTNMNEDYPSSLDESNPENAPQTDDGLEDELSDNTEENSLKSQDNDVYEDDSTDENSFDSVLDSENSTDEDDTLTQDNYSIFDDENDDTAFESHSENVEDSSENLSSEEDLTVENLTQSDDATVENETVAVEADDTSETPALTFKSDFDSIDFTSFETFSDEENYSQNNDPKDDSMDAFEQKFAEALAKAMAQTTQNEVPISTHFEETKVENETQIGDSQEENSIPQENNSPSSISEDEIDAVQVENDVPESVIETTENVKDNDQKTLQQVFASDFVFTEFQENVAPSPNPEEERERQERALRMMEEILESKNSSENVEPTPEIEFQFVEINDKVDTALTDTTVIKNKPEQDELTLYIKEQERINNYDWHKRLQRALVDVVEDSHEDDEKPDEFKINSTLTELKTLMATKNYILKSYPSHESKSFYTENYVFSNRIALSTALFTYLFMLAEIFIAFFCVDRFINKGLSFYIITAVALLAVPLFFFVKYGSFRDKRKPAKFFFGLSLVTSMMIYINLMVLVVLVAFFIPALQVDVSNLRTMILTIFYPAGLFLGIPVSVCIYAILYRSKRYHLH